MSSLKTTVCAAIAAAGIVAILLERDVAHAQRARLDALAAEEARIRQQIAALRTEAEVAARAGNDALAASATAVPASSLATETSAWLERYRQLKDLFGARPEQRIPEMELLSDRDYLMCARDASFLTEDGTRRALAAVRTTAKGKLVKALAAAVKDYRRAHGGQVPTDVAGLAAFLPETLNVSHLARWEVIPPRTDGRPVYDLLTEKVPVDVDYDSRVRLQTSGGTSTMGPPLAWIPDYADRARAAHQAFMRANHGASATGLAALLPYFDPPLDLASTERIQRFERGRSGR